MPAAYEFELDFSTTGNGLEGPLCETVAVWISIISEERREKGSQADTDTSPHTLPTPL